MSSNTAKDFTVPKHSLYAGSKGAIDSFVRVFSKDCGDKKITVNAVAPGGTVTDMFHDVSQHYIPNGEKYSAEERQAVCFTHLSRVCSSCEIQVSLTNSRHARWPPMLRPCTATGSPSTSRESSASWPVTRANGSMARLSRWTVVPPNLTPRTCVSRLDLRCSCRVESRDT